MPLLKLPYHNTFMDLEIAEEHLQAVLTSRAHAFKPLKGAAALVEEALDNPIGSPRLEQLVQGKKNMLIITSDHTRPVPSHITLPILLRRVRAVNPGIEISILVSTGTHRATTSAEMVQKFGADVAAREKFIIHDARCSADMASLGTLESGLPVELNKALLETELLVAEGFIEPHFFAGFSGGRKSVFPGTASLNCIMANHCAAYIASPQARTGVLKNNPVHVEALAVARLARLQFILNVVIDAEKHIISAFAGHYEQAHLAGCAFVGELARVKAAPAEIVITTNGGYPLDQNIYQAVKGMTAAEASCKPGGGIIMVAACSDGHGGAGFYETFRQAKSPQAVTAAIMRRGRLETLADQWEAQILARILEKHRVILVSDMCDKSLIEDMFMEHAVSIEEALALARRYMGQAAQVTVIPDGISVIVEP